jgi:hypothetical protein
MTAYSTDVHKCLSHWDRLLPIGYTSDGARLAVDHGMLAWRVALEMAGIPSKGSERCSISCSTEWCPGAGSWLAERVLTLHCRNMP